MSEHKCLKWNENHIEALMAAMTKSGCTIEQIDKAVKIYKGEVSA